MSKKCKLNTCSDPIPSMCVLYTGELIDGTYIELEDCDPTLNDYLEQVDTLLKKVLDNQPTIIDVTAANCGFTEISDLLLVSTNLDDDKVKVSKLIITLLNIICAQKAQLDAIPTDIWDYDLPDSILDNLGCFSGIIGDPCGNPIKIKTFKDLLLIMINRLCCVEPC